MLTGARWRFFWAEDSPARTSFGDGRVTRPWDFSDFVDDGEFHVYRFDFTDATEGKLIAFRWDGTAAYSSYEVDYVRLLDSTAPVSTVAIERSGDDVIISWEGAHTLQAASDISGAWSDSDQTSPATFTPADDSATFFRIRSN